MMWLMIQFVRIEQVKKDRTAGGGDSVSEQGGIFVGGQAFAKDPFLNRCVEAVLFFNLLKGVWRLVILLAFGV